VLVTDSRAPKARFSGGFRGHVSPGNFEIENTRDAIPSILSDFDNDFLDIFYFIFAKLIPLRYRVEQT